MPSLTEGPRPIHRDPPAALPSTRERRVRRARARGGKVAYAAASARRAIARTIPGDHQHLRKSTCEKATSECSAEACHSVKKVHNLLLQFFTLGSSKIEVFETCFYDIMIT